MLLEPSIVEVLRSVSLPLQRRPGAPHLVAGVLVQSVGWHALFDAMAVFASQTWNVYVTEALVVAAGIASIAVIFLLRDNPVGLEPESPAKIDMMPIEIETQKPSIDHLEDSRYV